MRKVCRQVTSYNVWANDRLYHFFKDKPLDSLDKQVVSSFSSIRKTIMHMWFAENIWHQRISGIPQKNFPGHHFDGDTHKALYELLQESIQIRDYVQSLSKKEFKKDITYSTTDGKKFTHARFQSIIHLVNHASYHRGQLITLARQTGFDEIPATDLIHYYRDLQID